MTAAMFTNEIKMWSTQEKIFFLFPEIQIQEHLPAITSQMRLLEDAI